MKNEKPVIDPHPLSEFFAWVGHRNRDLILDIFKEKLSKNPGQVLEIASGSGMHINYFAPHFEHLLFLPTDKDISVFGNIKRLISNFSNHNIADPIHLDVSNPTAWLNSQLPGSYSAIFCINLFQVAPVSLADGVIECANYLLDKSGRLFIYGGFKLGDDYSTTSNQDLNISAVSTETLEWSLKDLIDLKTVAQKHGFELKETIDTTDDNFMLVFGKQ